MEHCLLKIEVEEGAMEEEVVEVTLASGAERQATCPENAQTETKVRSLLEEVVEVEDNQEKKEVMEEDLMTNKPWVINHRDGVWEQEPNKKMNHHPIGGILHSLEIHQVISQLKKPLVGDNNQANLQTQEMSYQTGVKLKLPTMQEKVLVVGVAKPLKELMRLLAAVDGVTITMLISGEQQEQTTSIRVKEETPHLDHKDHKKKEEVEVMDVEVSDVVEVVQVAVDASNAVKKVTWQEIVQMLIPDHQEKAEEEAVKAEAEDASNVEKKVIFLVNVRIKISQETERAVTAAEEEVEDEAVLAINAIKKAISQENALMNKKVDPTRDKGEMMVAR